MFVMIDQFVDRTYLRESTSSAPVASRMSPWRIRFRRSCASLSPRRPMAESIAVVATGHLCVHRGSAILVACRMPCLPVARRRRDRHDRHDRGEARARSGNLLRDRRHGDRLRLLARGARCGRRRSGDKGDGRQRHKASALVARALREFPAEHEPCPVGSDRSLEYAVITHAEGRDPELVKKLDAVAGRVLRAK